MYVREGEGKLRRGVRPHKAKRKMKNEEGVQVKSAGLFFLMHILRISFR
jgi:hypothetical protein